MLSNCDAGEDSGESLRQKEIKPVNPIGNQPWTIIERTDVFKLWCWRRLLRIPWTVRRSNQSILKEINPDWKDWCRSWNSILVTWYEELTHCKRSWNWERLRAGGEGGVRRWDGWMASVTQWSPVWVSSHSSVLAWRVPGMGKPCGLSSMGSHRVRHHWSDLAAAAAAARI